MSETTPKIRIDSAEALFEALRSGDPAVCGPVLAAVAAAPAKAASYGPYKGRDLIDELLASAEQKHSPQERFPWLAALSAFDDQRSRCYLEQVFAGETDPRTLDLCAQALSRLPDDEAARVFRPHLAGDRPPHKIQITADALAGRIHDLPSVMVRIAVWSTKETSPPPLNEQSRDAWLDELNGPRTERARYFLEIGGAEAFSFLLKEWNRLGDPARLWLLEWGDRAEFDRLDEALDAALNAEGPTVVAGLKTLIRRPEWKNGRQDQIDQLADSTAPEVRRTAVLAGTTIPDVEAALNAESDSLVRCALLKRLEGRASEEAAKIAAAWCLDEDHRVRAAAVRALAAQGDHGGRCVDAWLKNGSPEQKAAAWLVQSQAESAKSIKSEKVIRDAMNS
jgi:hypothetical protein